MKIEFCENNVFVQIETDSEGGAHLKHLGLNPPRGCPQGREQRFRLVEIQESGMDHTDHHGCRHNGTQPGSLLRYKAHSDTRNAAGRKLEIVQEYEGLEVTSHLQFFDGAQAVRSWTSVANHSDTVRPLEYISSLALAGLLCESVTPRNLQGVMHIPHSTWSGEAQWKKYSLRDLGCDAIADEHSMKRISASSTGSWPCAETLPMGIFENTSSGQATAWQIETSASWNWEICDLFGCFYLLVSGPSCQENSFTKKLKPGDAFATEPCAVAFSKGGFSGVMAELTKYRRLIRRDCEDNRHPSVIFNDYMNCLMGDPTTEKLLPLIDAAAEAGARYFCIDCGWYDDGPWWDGVGEWLPAKARFPGGIEEPLAYIKKKGMVPGLWLEPEVMGINCPLAKKLPPECFFQRNGKVVISESRFQLDYRHPAVTAHMDAVIDRLVSEYGVGYIKMDYNINCGTGTEVNADSAGEGLLAHTRAYLAWLDGVLARHPSLVIENCGSGGMRMEYALLSRCALQSVTDQTDYLKMAAIAANAATAVAPEQAAIWSYPLKDGDEEEAAFNMVNALLLRIHQSGHLAEISAERFALVKEGLDLHKRIADALAQGIPFWPTGPASMSDDCISFGMECGKTIYLAVWCIRERDAPFRVPVEQAKGANAEASCIYPQGRPARYTWRKETAVLEAMLDPRTARIFEIRI